MHTFTKKPLVGKTYRNIDVVKDFLTKEIGEDTEFIQNKVFRKIPLNWQLYLSQPSMELGALGIKTPILKPTGEEKVPQERRYGVFAVHNKKVYVGYVVPEGKDKAEVKLKEVFP
jgi:hypothetical protein